MLDEFTDVISIIYEFISYQSLTVLIKSFNKWIHLLTEFSSLDEIICSLITIKLTEFIFYVNPYVKWNRWPNEFMYDFLDEFTDDGSIIYEFIYYLSLPALMKSLNKQIHMLNKFTWTDEIICSSITINLTEFICNVNSYVIWNHGTNKFIYDFI